ncbi:MAG: MFS transporter [Verrucomicrobiae bacterium]|nr:MFS transporter [Verrucomicrobiae bacterium]MCP5538782.1 MFS transporter [Akkermansiaceae bacterium]
MPTLLQLFVFLGLPITGMCYAVLGALKLPLAERLRMDEAKVGGLVSSFGIMVGPIILAAGFLSDAFGRQPVWVGGSILVTASLVTLSRARHYPAAVIAVLMLSGGWAAMINVANPVMFAAFKNPLTATNTGDFFFGLGAFLTPVGVDFLLRKFGYGKAVSFLAAAAAFAAVFGLAVNLEPGAAAGNAETAGGETGGFGGLLRDPVMWLCTLTLMLWAPLESATAAWSTTFVKDQAPAGEEEARSKRVAEWTLSGFWLCFMGSRLLMALYHNLKKTGHSIEEARVTHIVLAALVLLAMLGLTRSRRRGLTIGLILSAGLLMGPFFPNLMAVLLDHVPGTLAGRAVGVLFAGASIGWTLIPLLIGGVAKRTGDLHRGFRVAVADALLLLGLVIWHFLYARGLS